MPQFLVYMRDHAPHSMPLREEHRPAHRAYVLENDERIRLAGFMLDEDGQQCGSIYSFHASDIAEVRAFVDNEPYVRNSVYAQIDIVRWHPVLIRYDRSEWPG